MLLMVEKKLRGGICQATNRYAKSNNKYMKNYDKTIESSYLAHSDANNLYGWAMSQKLPINGFEWVKHLSKLNEDFIKEYDENSDKGYFLEVEVNYQKKYLIFIRIYHFYRKEKRLKRLKNLFVVQKKKKNIHIRALKQGLNHGLKLKKVYRVIHFKQEVWLKPYIDMNTELRTEAKNKFEIDFFKLMNNSVFGKTWENQINHKDIKLVTLDKRSFRT